MKRIRMAAVGVLAVTAAGCIDMGLEGNMPLEEAEHRPPLPLVAAVHQPVESVANRIIVNGRLWVPSGRPLTVEPSNLRAVGATEGRPVYAASWDRPPYDLLIMEIPAPAEVNRAEDAEARWVELRPVLGRTGPVPAGHDSAAAGAATDHGGHGGH